MLAVNPEEIVFQKFAPFQNDNRIYAFGIQHFCNFIFCLIHEITYSCKIYISLNNPLIDERANMNIFKVQVVLIFNLMINVRATFLDRGKNTIYHDSTFLYEYF